MVVYTGSRYENTEEVAYPLADGTTIIGLAIREIDTELENPSLIHQTKLEDRMDLMAGKYYKDAKKWWQIADKNPDILFPLDIVVGQEIKIP